MEDKYIIFFFFFFVHIEFYLISIKSVIEINENLYDLFEQKSIINLGDVTRVFLAILKYIYLYINI